MLFTFLSFASFAPILAIVGFCAWFVGVLFAGVTRHIELGRERKFPHARVIKIRGSGKSGGDNPDHAHAVGGGYARPSAIPAVGNVAKPQNGQDGSSALFTRSLPCPCCPRQRLLSRGDGWRLYEVS